MLFQPTTSPATFPKRPRVRRPLAARLLLLGAWPWLLMPPAGLAAPKAPAAAAAAAPAAPAAEATSAPPSPARGGSASPAATAWTLPLSRLVGDEQPVRLKTTAGEFRLSLPVPALWRAEEVTLELVGTASRALMGSSQLEVEVNGRVIAQMPLDGRQSEFRHNVAVPVALLRDGFNDVRLSAAQHVTERCEYPLAPEMWTQIDLARSRFRISASSRPVPLRLDRLDALFDKSGWHPSPQVDVLTANAPSPAVLSAMGLVAQGIGQRYDFIPARLASGRWPADPAALGAALARGARGAVLLGTFQQLAPYLAGLDVPTDSGPVVALRPLPDDPTRFALLLAARTEAELPRAAAAFAMQRMPWPEAPWAALRDLRMPMLDGLTGQAAGANAALIPETRAVPLSALHYRTTTFTGMGSRGAVVRFWNANWQGRLQVRLHMSHASGMSPQSALNLMANGVLHGSIPLSNTAGGIFENYALSVPAGALKPGWNTLELQPVLVPQSNGGDCKPFFPGNLALTVYEDSTVQAFGGSPMKRPDLALLAAEGRPTLTAPVGYGMAVLLTDAEDATVGAGLTLLAKLSQVFEGSLLAAALQVGDDPKAHNRLWVGALERLPDSVRDALQLDKMELPDNLPVPLLRSVEVQVLEGGETATRMREAIGAPSLPETLQARASLAHPDVRHAMAATVMASDRPLTVFTAASPAALQAGLYEVVDHGRWGQLRGGRALWRPGEPTLVTVTEEDAPFTAYTLRGGLGLWVSQYPWAALTLLLLLMALLVGLTRLVLSAYRRRHLPVQSGDGPSDKDKEVLRR